MVPSCLGPYDALSREHGYKEMQLQPAGVVLLAGDTVPCGRGDEGDQDLRGTTSQGGYLIQA